MYNKDKTCSVIICVQYVSKFTARQWQYSACNWCQ